MDAWAEQLKQVAQAGSFRLGCNVEALHDCAAQAGLSVLEARLHGVKGKPAFIAALAAACDAGPEFGGNWDALADALCDLPPADGYVLLLRDASDTLGLSANDREIAQDILSDTVLFWRQRNKPCWIFYA